MRFARTQLGLFLFIAIAATSHAQQATTQSPQSDAQALSIAAKSLAVLTGGTLPSDVTLTGTVTAIVGPDTETGTVTLFAKGTTQSRVDLKVPSLARTEIRNNLAVNPRGASIISDGSSQDWPLHNCWTEPVWFFPALSSLASGSDPSFALSYIGQETRNGISVQHIRTFRSISDKNPYVVALTQSLSTTDIFLDSTSSLPVAVTFYSHPDTDDGVNIPIEIDFSGYQVFGGVNVPSRIQKLIGGSVVFDITITSANLNTGLSDALFSVPQSSSPPLSAREALPGTEQRS